MPGQFVLEGGRASVVGVDNEEGAEAVFDNYVDPVKYVHNVFFDIDGSAEVWCEIELGNDHNQPIRIEEVHIGFNNIGQGTQNIDNLSPAETSYSNFGQSKVPLLLESTPDGESEKWHEMYDEYRLIGDDSPYFQHPEKQSEGNDRTFEYRLGPGEPHQHIYSIPVTFDEEYHVDGGETSHSYILKNIRKLNNREQESAQSPVILPDNRLEEQFSSSSRFDRQETGDFNEPTRIDTISIWIYWEESDLCVPKDDISYHFRYAVDCDIPKKIFTRAYPHYILPDKSVLMGRSMLMESLSEDTVEEFHPPEERWMFKEWEDEYDVKDMSSARMTRSKVKQDDHVFNSGRIGFPALRARHTMLQFILIITSGWAVQETFSEVSISDFLTSPLPMSDTWPLLVLPVSAYLLTKGYGPPPFFPESLKQYISPTEDLVLERVNKVINLPFAIGSIIKEWLGRASTFLGGLIQ